MTLELKSFFCEKPEGRFIAIFHDWSGCDMFEPIGEECYDTVSRKYGPDAVDIDWFLDTGYAWFINVGKVGRQ